jgi:hypothetical protein
MTRLFHASGIQFIALLELFLHGSRGIEHAIPASFADTSSLVFISSPGRVIACRAFTFRASYAVVAFKSGLHLQMIANVRFIVTQRLTLHTLHARKHSPSHGKRDGPHCRVSEVAKKEMCFVANKWKYSLLSLLPV